MKQLKILYGYSYFPSEAYGDVETQNLKYIKKLNDLGFNVAGFCLTIDPPAQALTFPELDRKWRRGDRKLLKLYDELEKSLDGVDIFINSSGINLHPDFVNKLMVFTVFQCFDDPENSINLSKPAAWAYDLCLVGNIAELNTYKSWGVKNVEWVPMGLQPEIYDPTLTYEDIIDERRDIDIFMMADKLSPWRKDRMEKLEKALPNANFYGNGWKKGYLPLNKQLNFLRRSKIGPNVHNSTGPINYRTFYLPANGVMQICDNKQHLGKIFELDKEVVGFNTIEECIELCRYYLAHDKERRLIAANGWKRVMRDYTEEAIFQRNMVLFKKYMKIKNERRFEIGIAEQQFKKTRVPRFVDTLFKK